MTRPLETRSRVITSSATCTGWWSGSRITEVPTRRRVVRAATAVATISGEGRNPSLSWWCSPKKQESKPLASASWASAMTSSMQRSRCSPRGGLAIEL